jgi:plastocyanin
VNRIDATSAILALLMGFILSAGMTGLVLSTGNYQLPHVGGMPMAAAPMTAPSVAAPVAVQAQAPVSQAASEIKVTATDLKFTPATIQAKVGQPVKIVLENKGAMEHDISFPTVKADKPGASLKVVAKPGQTATLEFTPTAAGSFEYFCSIPGHRESGMKGTISVAP